MLSDGALDIVMAHSQDFHNSKFLGKYADEELDEALNWFRENKPRSSARRQQRIREEKKKREAEHRAIWKDKGVYYKDPGREQWFIREWNETRNALREVMHCGQQAVL